MNKMDKKSRDLVMGKLYFKNKDYNMAESCFIEYLNSSPEDFQALKLLAQVYENMRNIPKAFELYERCFLAEPERKGVLLDICRLLLMKDTGLSRVDQKKWLKLAIQTFPSNPIVVNLRESLPATEHKPSQRKSAATDAAVLDKLGALQKQLEAFGQYQENLEKQIGSIVERSLGGLQNRLETMDRHQASLEKQIGGICDQLKAININLNKKKDSPAPPPPAAEVARPADLKTTPSATAAQTVVTPAITPVAPLVASPAAPVVAPPVSNGLFFNSTPFSFQTESLSTNLFANSLAKFNLPTDGKWGPQKPDEKAADNNESKIVFPFTMKDTKVESNDKVEQDNSNRTLDFSFQKKDTQPLGDENSKPDDSAHKFTFSFSPKKDAPAESDDDGEDDDHVKEVELPIENTCDMQPIQVQTGEENEDMVFEQRCKLHRFKDKEYKERGIGNMKVLKHKETGKGRLIMRRELVGLVCLNCWSLSKIERVRDNTVRFAGIDASDGEAEMTVFLAKFKTQELTDSFINHLTNLFPEESSG